MPLPPGPPPASLIDGATLFLDFDGTLVELADAPDAIHVGAHLPALLARLQERLEGRVAIVSGRGIKDLERHIDLGAICVSGSHGLELRLPGKSAAPVAAPPGLGEATDAVEAFAAGAEGLKIERKPFGVALHYRQAPGVEGHVLAFMRALAETSGFVLQRGKMVAELRPAGASKGDAIRRFMENPPFIGSRPLFLGDDVTDEHGFEAAAALGGGGVLIGMERPTAARWRLPDVAATARWLEQAAGL